MGTLFENLEWLLLILPLSSTLLNGASGSWLTRRGRRMMAYVGVGGALLTSLPLLVGESMAPGLVGHPSPLPWIRIWDGERFIEGALILRIDTLSIFMVLTILTAAFFILRYFADASRRELVWFGCYLIALLLLALADNFIMLLLGWSLVGWLPIVAPHSRTEEKTETARKWTVALASDLSLLTAVGLTARHMGSLSVGGLTAMWPLPPDMSLAASFMVVAAILRVTQFKALPMPGAMTHALGMLPAMYLIGRVYYLLMAFATPRLLLCGWGFISSLILATAATAADNEQRARFIQTALAGLMITAIGLGGWEIAFSMLIPAVLIRCLLYCAMSRGRSGRWWSVLGFIAMSGLPLTPSFAFYSGLLSIAWREGWLAAAITSLIVALIAAAAGRAVKDAASQAGESTAGNVSALSATSWLIALIGLLNLAAPPPAGRFLSPILGETAGKVGIGWYALAATIAIAGTAAGYLLKLPSHLVTPVRETIDLCDVNGRGVMAAARALRTVGRNLLAAEKRLTVYISRSAKRIAAGGIGIVLAFTTLVVCWWCPSIVLVDLWRGGISLTPPPGPLPSPAGRERGGKASTASRGWGEDRCPAASTQDGETTRVLRRGK